MQVVVKLTDGSEHRADMVKLNLRDQVEFERHFKTSVAVIGRFEQVAEAMKDGGQPAPEDMPPMEQMLFLAYRALVRGKALTMPFEQFLDETDELSYVADEADEDEIDNDPGEGEPDPTPAVPQGDS